MKKYLLYLVKIITGVAAAGTFWGITEALLNRFWPPVGVWHPDLLLTSIYRRVWFYGVFVAALAALWGLARGGWWLLRGRKAAVRPRTWALAAAFGTVLVANAGWLVMGLVKKADLELGFFALNLHDRMGFNYYWLGFAFLAAAVSVLIGLACGRRAWFRALGRYARVAGSAAFVAAFATYHIGQALRPRPQGPNVVLIVLDAWRGDTFRPDLMPHTSKFARGHALTFERTWTPSTWTIPAMASMFTGEYADTNMTRQNPDADVKCPTLAQVLRDAGYDTTAFVANRIIDRNHTITDGFENYAFSDWPAWLRWTSFFDTNWYGPAVRGLMHKDADAEDSFKLTKMTADYVGRKHDRPFFLWTHYMDPHAPYAPPEGYYDAEDADSRNGFNQFNRERRMSNLRLYLGECRYLDDLLGQILPYIISDRRTVLIVTSDHGEEFWEHGVYTVGHGKSAYDSLMRVPLFISIPGVEPAVVDQPTSTLDLAPTILTLSGMAPVPTMQGKPFLTAAGKVVPRGEPLLIGSSFFKVTKNKPERKDAAILWPYKLILFHYRDARPGEYYNLENDPDEKTRLAEDERAAALRRELKGWKKRVIKEREGVEYGGASTTDLRALGYIN